MNLNSKVLGAVAAGATVAGVGIGLVANATHKAPTTEEFELITGKTARRHVSEGYATSFERVGAAGVAGVFIGYLGVGLAAAQNNPVLSTASLGLMLLGGAAGLTTFLDQK